MKKGTRVLNLPILFDHVSGFLGDHDRRCVRIAGCDRWHDRGIDHSKSIYAVHLQSGVDHRHFVRGGSHFTRSARVVNS